MSGVTAFLCSLIIAAAIADRHDGPGYVALLVLAAISAVTDPRPGRSPREPDHDPEEGQP